MNEKTAKKVGEAHAFAQTLQNLVTNHKEVSTELFGERTDELFQATDIQKQRLEEVAEKYGTKEIVLPKSQKTVEKITSMGDTYVGDEWDNAVEVMEWVSFLLGGALIHWQLIHGSAQVLGDEDFTTATTDGVQVYSELVATVRTKAEEVGKERASN